MGARQTISKFFFFCVKNKYKEILWKCNMALEGSKNSYHELNLQHNCNNGFITSYSICFLPIWLCDGQQLKKWYKEQITRCQIQFGWCSLNIDFKNWNSQEAIMRWIRSFNAYWSYCLIILSFSIKLRRNFQRELKSEKWLELLCYDASLWFLRTRYLDIINIKF